MSVYILPSLVMQSAPAEGNRAAFTLLWRHLPTPIDRSCFLVRNAASSVYARRSHQDGGVIQLPSQLLGFSQHVLPALPATELLPQHGGHVERRRFHSARCITRTTKAMGKGERGFGSLAARSFFQSADDFVDRTSFEDPSRRFLEDDGIFATHVSNH